MQKAGRRIFQTGKSPCKSPGQPNSINGHFSTSSLPPTPGYPTAHQGTSRPHGTQHDLVAYFVCALPARGCRRQRQEDQGGSAKWALGPGPCG